MLHELIYPILVKELFKYIYMIMHEKSIYFHVFGYSIVITPTSIAQAINCLNPSGIIVEHFGLTYNFI